MKENILRFLVSLTLTMLLSCASTGDKSGARYHEKMWIIDGETDHAVAVVGGLNIANEYFRIDLQNTGRYWRDQDVIVGGDVIKDMVATFERNFEYFLKISAAFVETVKDAVYQLQKEFGIFIENAL